MNCFYKLHPRILRLLSRYIFKIFNVTFLLSRGNIVAIFFSELSNDDENNIGVYCIFFVSILTLDNTDLYSLYHDHSQDRKIESCKINWYNQML